MFVELLSMFKPLMAVLPWGPLWKSSSISVLVVASGVGICQYSHFPSSCCYCQLALQPQSLCLIVWP